MELQIKKVKIDKKGIATIWYVQTQDNGKKPKLTHEGDAIVHDDFRNAVDELAPHYALISGYASFNKGLRLEGLKTGVDNFRISGYSLGGKEEDEGITITGHVIVPWSGKAAILNSPFQRFGEEEDNKAHYKFIDQLAEVVEKIVVEAKDYINGKCKPEAQGDLFAQTGEENSGTVINPSGELESVEPEQNEE